MPLTNEEMSDMCNVFSASDDDSDADVEIEIKRKPVMKKVVAKSKPVAKKVIMPKKEIEEQISIDASMIPVVLSRDDNISEEVKKPQAELFSYTFPKVIEKIEVFDIDKAYHMVEHSEEYLPLLTHDDCENGEEIQKNKLELLDRYIKSSGDRRVVVDYSQKEHSKGRYFAKHGLSLANMGKQLRHTIAGDYYDDLDMVNAHPVILKFICDKSNIECEHLTKFINNRDDYYEMLKVDRDTAKKICLTVINKHEVDTAELKKKYSCAITKPFREFIMELVGIRESLIEKYNKLAEEFRTYKQKQNLGFDIFNFEGSFINILMCDVENYILQNIVKFFGDPSDCVLCFDGVMLKKSLTAKSKIKACEAFVKKHVGIEVKLAVKPMDKGFNIPNPDKYIDIKKCINPRDSYTFGDFRRRYTSEVFTSYGQLTNKFYDDSCRVLAKVTQTEGCYIKKDNVGNNVFSKIKGINKIIDFTIKYNDCIEKKVKDSKGKGYHNEIEDVEKSILMSKLLGEKVKTYDEIVCEEKASDKQFNVWRGVIAKAVDNVNMDLVQPMLDFIKEVWCKNDDTMFHYLMSWIALTATKPMKLNEVALFVYSEEQGTGKNTLTDFLNEFVLGEWICSEEAGINGIVQKHNTQLEGKKLVIINEMASTREEFKANFDTMKHLITGKKLYIEPKGINKYDIRNISNWILISNNKDAIRIEAKDRRYCCIDISDSKVNDRKYFGELRRKCFNQECGDHFYTYLSKYKCLDVADISNIPMNGLKKSIIESSKCSLEQFYDWFISEYNMDEENKTEEFINLGNIIGASELYKMYGTYCSTNNLKGVFAANKFGEYISKKFEKKRNKQGYYYTLQADE